MHLTKSDLAPIHAASTDAGRSNINLLRFDTGEGETGRIYATDGYVLASVPMPEHGELESFSMRLDGAKQLQRAIKPQQPAILNEPDTNANGAAKAVIGGLTMELPKVLDGEYPDTKQVIPTFGDECLEVGIGIAVLETILKVAKQRGGRALKFRFASGTEEIAGKTHQKAALSTFIVEGADDLQIVAMPMRL